ncbi:siderophore-interacting protein [Actinocatenispora rupis]|uniref:Siderophore-interacting protein n=1 Tax=Actinocatenispora rupis TaxID=519421 RepID=A0A8J3NDI1_9ACTN|nr:siderophore-interacting protein [Actinocatenispora rupis]GID12950.1 siderophore-interacting protein [Actinocatenispora rupis]
MPEKAGRGRTTRLTVLRTEWLTPHLVRIVAGGPELAEFTPNAYSDQYVKIIFRRPGVDYPEPFDMASAREQLPREQWPVLRTYTVRRCTDDELVLDFVYHGEEGLAGPWAAGLKPGDEVLFLGPGGAYAPDQAADWHLLVGDEAALPAIAAALERVPAGVPAWAFVEVAGPDEELPLDTGDATTVRWLHRGTGDTLPAAVRALDLPTGRGQVFVHGEAGMVKELRGHLFGTLGLDRDQVSISGYWRRGMDDEAFRVAKRAEREAEENGAA